MLVVSPLIALMKDQLAHLPPGLPGAMLWFGQQATEALKTLAAIRVGSHHMPSVGLAFSYQHMSCPPHCCASMPEG